MSHDLTCQSCGLPTWVDKDGKRHPLEVCYSGRHDELRCGRCHFKPTEDELKGNADAG